MKLSSVFRRALAGTAATVALIGTPSAQAQNVKPETAFADQLNNICLSFDNTRRRLHPYDEGLGLLADKITGFSAWQEIEAGMEASGQAYEGLCPNTTSQPPVALAPGARGFAVNVIDKSTGRAINPVLFGAMAKDGFLDAIVERTITMSAALSTENIKSPLIEKDRDLETQIILNTVRAAHTQATTITLVVERAAREGQTAELRRMIAGSPSRAAILSAYYDQAVAAFKQPRHLRSAERHAFRDLVADTMLKDPNIRKNIVKTLVEAQKNTIIQKAVDDMEANRPLDLAVTKPFDERYLNERLSRLPGDLANSTAIKSHLTYWQQKRLKGEDPLAAGEEEIKDAIQKIKNNEADLRKEAQQSRQSKAVTNPAP